MKATGLLPRGRDVETLNPPKCPTPPGCHHRSPPARFELDVWRGPTRVHREAPRRGQTRARRFPFCYVYPTLISYQLSDVANGLRYLHSCNVIHGDLKGVRDCRQSCFTPR